MAGSEKGAYQRSAKLVTTTLLLLDYPWQACIIFNEITEIVVASHPSVCNWPKAQGILQAFLSRLSNKLYKSSDVI